MRSLFAGCHASALVVPPLFWTKLRLHFSLLLVMSLVFFASGARAETLVTGTWAETGSFGFDEKGNFSCTGTPSCKGQYNQRVRRENCSNYASFNGEFGFPNLDLSTSGAKSGQVTMKGPDWDSVAVNKPDGTCEYPNPPIIASSFPYTGTWDATTKTGSLNVTIPSAGGSATQVFNFKADTSAPTPVFPMTVTSNVDLRTTTATAVIQFRPQDVGTTGKIYVFARAPASLVRSATGAPLSKDGNNSCVLAQLDSSGQLISVVAGSLQASSSGVLSATGSTVNILNGVPTSNVAGTTFYVGYGPDPTTMLTNGTSRNAITIPGTTTCG